jgi:hypothetical protein
MTLPRRPERHRRGVCVQNLHHLEVRQRLPVNPGQVLQLDEVHPPLARLELRHERLRTAQLARNLHLCQPSIQPRLLEPPPKSPVVSSVVPAFQGRTSLSSSEGAYTFFCTNIPK